MSIPKEPRQQMINVMYLVLIALLAMNVSAEILNAFKIVDKGISNSNSSLTDKTNLTMESFEKAIEKNKRGKPLLDAASKVRPITEEFTAYVDELYNYMIEQSGTDEETGDPNYGYLKKLDDQDTPTRILVLGENETEAYDGKAFELEQKINECKDKYLAVFQEVIDKGGLQADQKKTLSTLKEQLAEDLPLSAPAPPEDSDKKDWATYNFYQVPILPVLTLMNQFKNNAHASEAMVVDKLFSMVGEKVEIYDKLKAQVVPVNGTTLLQGEEFVADIFVAATSSQSKPSISVNGQSLPVKDGIATYKTKAAATGKKTITASVRVKDGFGDMKTLSEKLEYNVIARPDHVPVVSADKMNVFYIGVDNPISASITGVRSDKTNVSISGGGGTVNSKGAGKYTVRVTSPGKASVNLSGKAKDGSPVNGSMEFRVKYIPDPVPEVGGKQGGKMGTGEWKAQDGVIARLKDFEFDARFNVTGFEMTCAERNADLLTCVNSGAKFNSKCRNLVNRAKVGAIYYIDNIKAKGPDGKTRTLPTISFKIR